MAEDRKDTAPGARKGFFAKVKRGLFMTHTEILEKLGTAVKESLGIDESVLASLEEALLSADVGGDTADALTRSVRSRAGVSRRQDVEALKELLLEEIEKIIASAPRPGPRPDVPLFVTFLVGVNGSGKTTTTAKLAAREKGAGRAVLLAAADTFRAAAVEQLEEWGRRANVPVVAQAPGAGLPYEPPAAPDHVVKPHEVDAAARIAKALADLLP